MVSPARPVVSLHYIGLNLKKGVSAEGFEAFVRTSGIELPAYPGWRWTLLKGLRGERAHQYLMLLEAPDAGQYAQYVAADGEATAAAHRFWQQHPAGMALRARWTSFATFAQLPTIHSTYSVIAANEASTLADGPKYQVLPDGTVQARVLGIHNVALRPGIAPDAFERFIIDNVHRVADYPGWKFHFLRGDGGNRRDQYAVMLEIESLACLHAFHPEMDVSTDLATAFVHAHPDAEAFNEEWRGYASFPGAPQLYTDYIAIGGNSGALEPGAPR